MIKIKDFELEPFGGYVRIIAILEVSIDARTVTIRMPMKIHSTLQENKQRIKEYIQIIRQLDFEKLAPLKQFIGVDLEND